VRVTVPTSGNEDLRVLLIVVLSPIEALGVQRQLQNLPVFVLQSLEMGRPERQRFDERPKQFAKLVERNRLVPCIAAISSAARSNASLLAGTKSAEARRNGPRGRFLAFGTATSP
jgi:hypothetical protein